MRRFCLLGLYILWLLPSSPAWGWGEEGHCIVLDSACQALPEPARSFYAAQLPFLLAHAIDPDDWSLIDPEEARRHYLDLELLGPEPLANLPTTYQEALARFGPETLSQAGTLPWTILEFLGKLTGANRQGDWERSALLAAALGHYLADSCMPLHTTVNYKGELTGNLILPDRADHRHVHVRFEVAMLRQFQEELRSSVPAQVVPAQPMDDPFALLRRLLSESHASIDPILRTDKELTDSFGARFDAEFYSSLYERTGELAEERLARAAQATASFWLSAWQLAGRPELPRERVAFGEQVLLMERGHLDGPEQRATKVFVKDGAAYWVVSADWPEAGRFRARGPLASDAYQGLWRELEGASVWELEEAPSPARMGPTVTVTVARQGREHSFTVEAPEAQQDTRYGRIYRAIRTVAPQTPGPEPVRPEQALQPRSGQTLRRSLPGRWLGSVSQRPGRREALDIRKQGA